jgi:hypothetical protein
VPVQHIPGTVRYTLLYLVPLVGGLRTTCNSYWPKKTSPVEWKANPYTMEGIPVPMHK